MFRLFFHSQFQNALWFECMDGDVCAIGIANNALLCSSPQINQTLPHIFFFLSFFI